MQVNIKKLIDEVQCYQTVREMRWPDGVVCPSQTPPRPPFHQCIIKAVGFFEVEKPITPSKTMKSFSGRPRKPSRLNDA